MSRLENQEDSNSSEPINEYFLDEQVLKCNEIMEVRWYADLANFLASGIIHSDFTYHQRKRFLHEFKSYFWEEPYLLKKCVEQMIRRCVANKEIEKILFHCHNSPRGGHFGGSITATKVLQSEFYWLTLFKDCHEYVSKCDRFQRVGNLSKRSEMPLNNIIEVELFDVWGIDFTGLFPPSYGNSYIFVAVDYVSKWVEVGAYPTNDVKVVLLFLHKHIFMHFGIPRAIISDEGSHFMNKWFSALLNTMFVIRYHPQINGQAEFSNRIIKSVLETIVNPNMKDWSKD